MELSKPQKRKRPRSLLPFPALPPRVHPYFWLNLVRLDWFTMSVEKIWVMRTMNTHSSSDGFVAGPVIKDLYLWNQSVHGLESD